MIFKSILLEKMIFNLLYYENLLQENMMMILKIEI